MVQQSSFRLSRRQLVTTLSGAAVGLSGCLGWVRSSMQPAPITDTAVNPFVLTVTLNEEVTVDAVRLLTSSGRPVAGTRVSAGQTTVDLPLVTQGYRPSPLAPGTYTLVAANGGETVGQQEIDLKAAWELSDVRLTRGNTDRQAPAGNKSQASAAAPLSVTFTNTGRLPIQLSYLGMTGGVPTPDPPPDAGGSPSFSRRDTERDRLSAFVGGGQTATFALSSTMTFLFFDGSRPQWQREAAQCKNYTHDATLTVVMPPTGKRTVTVPVTYNGRSIRSLSGQRCSTVTAGNASGTP